MRKNARRLFAALCVLMLVLSTLSLYAISFFNHPYYDDFGFAAPMHRVWKNTGSIQAVAEEAFRAAQRTRQTWQGTYTGTILSNLQPGLFSEELYWIGNWFILTALIACTAFFLCTAFEKLGLERWARISLSSLALMVIIQFMPDPGEAFFWFNGGIGNVFIYGLMALSAALCIRLYCCRGKGVLLTVLLAVLAVALGGGSYGGGLFGLCMGACGLVWLFVRKGNRKWHFAALYVLFAACFVYSMAAPGNKVRAFYVQYYYSSAVKTVLQSFYYGLGQIGEYASLPVIGITLPLLPALYGAAHRSRWSFRFPGLVIALGVCLYCTQFAPPLHSIASIGDGRIVNTYFISFVLLWFFGVYYVLGAIARKLELPTLSDRQKGALLLAGMFLFASGSLAFRRPVDAPYGIWNLSGTSALRSLLNGEAAQYDREMTERERLLNDDSQPEITLEPLTSVPSVFMEDLIVPDAVYDVRDSLRLYYRKQVIHIAGEEAAP